MKEVSQVEIKNKEKGRRISLIFHACVILLAFLVRCPHDPEKALDTQYAVAVKFEAIPEFTRETTSNSTKSKAKSGKPRPKADPITKIEEKKIDQIKVEKPKTKITPKPVPKPKPTLPTEPIIAENTVEESVIEAVEEPIEIDEPELEPEPAEEMPEPEIEPDPVTKPNPRGGKTTSSPNQAPQSEDPSVMNGKDGGSGKGIEGDGPGADADGDDNDSGSGSGGVGTGEFDGSGNGVFGRKVIKRNIGEILKANFENQSGKKIVAKYCVDRAGNITYAEIDFSETTAVVTNSQLKQVLKGLYGYKVEEDMSAPKEQCGKMKVTLTEINAFR